MNVNIKYWLYKKDISLLELSRLSGVPYSTLRRIIRTSQAHTEKLEKIAKALKIEVKDLFIEA